MSSSNASDPSVEVERPTAEIIAFPARAQAEVSPSTPSSVVPQSSLPQTDDRLMRALESLNAALAGQRAALAAWRGALGELKTTTSGLSESLKRYQSSLGSLSGSVSSLNDKARSLEKWADGANSK